VTTLPEGDYTITVKDLSEFHNFHLVGPGVNEATSVETTGTVTWNVHLRSGTYTFQCDPHATQMKGTVTVGAPAATTTTTATGGAAAPKPPVVVGTVGPGFSIHLTKGGKRVKSLKAGRYTFRIADRAKVHNFVLEKSKGGTFERAITSVPFVGTKSIVVNLTKGSWEFYCAPHEPTMHGDFTVT
jgi:plastocyanin